MRSPRRSPNSTADARSSLGLTAKSEWHPPRKLARRDQSSVAIGVATAFGIPLLLIALGKSGAGGPAWSGAWVAYSVVVPVTAIILATRTSPRHRGWGLGLLVGWGVVAAIAVGLLIKVLSEF